MPLYEYKCLKCLKIHEIMQKFSDPLVTECPDCGGIVEKLMSLSAFSLKGTGWYATDYKRKPSGSGEHSGGAGGGNGKGGGTAGEGSKGGTGGESKAETQVAAGPKAESAPASGATAPKAIP